MSRGGKGPRERAVAGRHRTDVQDRERSSIRLVILASVILSAALPLVLYALYRIGEAHPVFKSPWSAGEMLGYLGAVAGAAVALMGLLYSIRDGWRQQRDQTRESAAPYFSAVFLRQKNKRLHSSNAANGNGDEGVLGCDGDCHGATESFMAYCEVDERKIYAFLGEEITYGFKLSADQRDRVESSFLDIEPVKGVVFTALNPVIYVPIRFRNVGQGCANGVRVGVNRKDEDWAGVCSWSIDRGEDFYLGVYIDTDAENVLGDYEIRIVFSDCLEYEYIERFKLLVDKNDQGRPRSAVEYIGRKTVLDEGEFQPRVNACHD